MKYLTLVLIFVAIFVALSKFDEKSTKTMRIGSTTINIEVADTDEERIRGLSGKSGLAPNEGLLFNFEKEGYYGIWMKDMKFPIDIAWLDKDKKIIYIEKNVSPDTYPKVFYPYVGELQSLSTFVLETPSGFFENAKIEIGDQAEF